MVYQVLLLSVLILLIHYIVPEEKCSLSRLVLSFFCYILSSNSLKDTSNLTEQYCCLLFPLEKNQS